MPWNEKRCLQQTQCFVAVAAPEHVVCTVADDIIMHSAAPMDGRTTLPTHPPTDSPTLLGYKSSVKHWE